MVARLHDEDGRVAIPGFYDRVRTLGADERSELAKVPFDEAGFRGAAGAAGDWGEAGYSVVERLGARPTLDVNGIWSGWTGAGAKTVLPSEASAKISMRLVPDQDPDEIGALFEAHMKRLAPQGSVVEVRALHGGKPALVDRSIPAMQAAAIAYRDTFGREPVYTREGGTIPVVAMLDDVLGLQTVLMGFGLPDDNLHAPNEKLDLDNYNLGIETVIRFLAALAEGDRQPGQERRA
jgi:acetylornithine deacetylase/succinyl-diaminopimelate desuccinylase-like protein